MVSAIYAALAALALVVLSIRVIRLRRAHRVSVGPGGNPALERAMRVQANFAEYTPMILLLMVLAELQGMASWMVHAAGVIFLAGRASHFVGFRSAEAPGKFRVAGMAITFFVLIALAIRIALQYLAGAAPM